MEIFHTLDVVLSLLMGIGQRGRNLFFLIYVSSNPLFSKSSNFSRSSVFFGSFVKFTKSASLGFGDCTWGLTAVRSLGGEKNCIVYSLLWLFTISIISSSISSIISFVVLLNFLYLNQQVSLFMYFSSFSHWGRRGGVSEPLSGANCKLLG